MVRIHAGQPVFLKKMRHLMQLTQFPHRIRLNLTEGK